MIIERSYHTRDFQLAARVCEPAAPRHTLLFLHGWLDNAASFSSLFHELQRTCPDAVLLALDLPGHGMSSHARSGFYPFHDYLDALHQVIEQLHYSQNITLVGHSMGALVASCYSAAFPERIERLVQIEGYGPIHEPEQNSLRRLRRGIKSRERVVNKPPRYFTSRQEMQLARATKADVSEADMAPMVERDSVLTEQGWGWRHDARLRADSLYRMSAAHAEAVIQALPTNNILILGEQGYAYLQPQKLAWRHPDTRIVSVAGGHHCHLSHPVLVSSAISDFILAT